MGLMPLLYYYNRQGVYVRSLLYGILYWTGHGTPAEIVDRKFLFTLYRRSFEEVIIANKERIIRRIGRRIGSGAEVTLQTARYFNGLLKLLVEYNGKHDDGQFESSHDKLIRTLGKDEDEDVVVDDESSARTFRGANRDAVTVRDLLQNCAVCEICEGRYIPAEHTQIDHAMHYSKGGPTATKNARTTHPFCNNRREKIELLVSGTERIALPPFDDADVPKSGTQLSFMFFEEEEESEGPVVPDDSQSVV
jgi:hypothetical protein